MDAKLLKLICEMCLECDPLQMLGAEDGKYLLDELNKEAQRHGLRFWSDLVQDPEMGRDVH